MKAIILAGGYARRLLPLTKNQAKCLLLVAGRPMIERVLESLGTIPDLESIHVVSNDKFYLDICRWLEGYKSTNGHYDIRIINNGSREGKQEIGAIGNICFALDSAMIDDDVIVIASDNLFSQSLEEFVAFAQRKSAPVIAVYTLSNLAEARAYGYVEVNEEGRVSYFQEKPTELKGTTIGVALYYYPKSSLALLRRYINEKNNSEEPGRLVEWMYEQTDFFAWNVPGIWCDIGSLQKLEEANRIFSKVDRAVG